MIKGVDKQGRGRGVSQDAPSLWTKPVWIKRKKEKIGLKKWSFCFFNGYSSLLYVYLRVYLYLSVCMYLHEARPTFGPSLAPETVLLTTKLYTGKAMWMRPEGWVMDLGHCQGPVLQVSTYRSSRYRQPAVGGRFVGWDSWEKETEKLEPRNGVRKCEQSLLCLKSRFQRELQELLNALCGLLDHRGQWKNVVKNVTSVRWVS